MTIQEPWTMARRRRQAAPAAVVVCGGAARLRDGDAYWGQKMLIELGGIDLIRLILTARTYGQQNRSTGSW